MTSPLTSWPTTPIPDAIKTLISDYYALTSQQGEEAFEAYLNLFIPTAEIRGARTVKGHAEIRERHNAQKKTKSKHHAITKVYSCNETGDDLLLLGNGQVVMEDGLEMDSGFCARMMLVETEEGWKVAYYEAWNSWQDLKEPLVKSLQSSLGKAKKDDSRTKSKAEPTTGTKSSGLRRLFKK